MIETHFQIACGFLGLCPERERPRLRLSTPQGVCICGDLILIMI